jgi:putative membrane protein
MNDPANPHDGFSGPRVIHEAAPRDPARPVAIAPAPMVFATEDTERVMPRERTVTPPSRAMLTTPRRRDRWVRLGLYGVGVAFGGWLGIDAYLWISDAFASSATLGTVATAAVTVGVVGAGLVIGRELKSFFALRSVEANQQRFAADGATLRPAEMRDAIRSVLVGVPKDRESEAAIEAYQRQAQPHHTPAQQLELLSRTVMTPLDRRAEAVVRRATARAFGITAVSPTAITDAVFFIAMSVRMVRGIAACYGHRPTAAATTHLLRRLVVEAGRLGAVDLAGMTLTQHISGGLAERLAANTAESMYAGQRMARIGLITMGMCRPVPFQPHEVPGMFSSLIVSLFGRKPDHEQ